ncbi:hypothetical protein M514_04233 [Trichuris suis]|uniref:BPTI/Kunitz inhibitor domain-containing protein n=1 Tax=Trichuris suis TaxID=68888 RepID=A0A085NQC9_9BILA|nr:hypothetical protein M513_04233 [Trichuris suis]KFD71675.1 hypothetical protein M514_04233 [Trichuris suis]KHJ45925.1 Kunitz/Bovine pancreatic trypsin inhibitor domain protein [Trichuris suis]
MCVPLSRRRSWGTASADLFCAFYPPVLTPQLCSLSIDSGTCANVQTRYAYDRQQRKCVAFMYNGCGGNLNNFLTMEDCIEVCQKTDQFDYAKRASVQRSQDHAEETDSQTNGSSK